LAPVIFALAFANQKNDRDSVNSNIQSSVRFPTFILLFLGVVTLNSIAAIPAEAKSVIGTVSTILPDGSSGCDRTFRRYEKTATTRVQASCIEPGCIRFYCRDELWLALDLNVRTETSSSLSILLETE
jgi:Conserved hypothetical protein 698